MAIDTLAADPVAQLGALVLADAAVAQSLCETQTASSFVERMVSIATARGIALEGAALHSAAQSDPLGIARWQTIPLPIPHWPPPPWLPIQVSAANGELFVDWAYFGPAPLRQSFFEDSIRQALRQPFNRLFLYRTSLGDFMADFQSRTREASLAPDGFIFHMSRCGSTLVSQMLAALPDNIAISEAAPIDAIVRLNQRWPSPPTAGHAQLLSAMVAAFGRRRSGAERRFFIKLDSWHALALPLFRQAFPHVPWVFLYRDPVEVMVSQSRQPGMQMVPGILPPSVYGFNDAGNIPGDEYSAKVLGKVCEAAADNQALGGGLPINYRDLPVAFWSKIMPHFGISVGAEDRERMQQAARYDAKAPQFEFANDCDNKQREASTNLRALAETYVGPAYPRLEELAACQI
jgi:hypothetical protein